MKWELAAACGVGAKRQRGVIVSKENSTETTAQLRDRIDNARVGDKLAWPDPAAAPLGTDDEAAGTSPSMLQVKLAAQTASSSRPSAPRYRQPAYTRSGP